MSNIIYTSYGFGRPNNDDKYGKFHDEEWASVQRNKINTYCSNNNINLKVIDYDNRYMAKILSNFDSCNDVYSKSHSVYTLSAIAAILDFCDSEHDIFYWLHLDMAIKNPNINIFDVFKLNDDSIYCWSFDKALYSHDNNCYNEWEKCKLDMRKAVFNAFNIEFPEDTDSIHMVCNASNLIMNKNAALKIRDTILNTIDFINNTVDFIVIEETIIEVINILSENIVIKDISKVPTIGDYSGKPFPQTFKWENGDDPIETHNDAIFIHFWGKNKENIPAFYEAIK
jgi:hypothetical protein